jgi:ABC-type branched-subunit amino acid transport system ATPase component
MNILKLLDIHVSLGPVVVLRGISMSVNEGSITCITGPNGAGKTTLLKTIVGLFKPSRGSIIFDNEDVTKKSPRYRVMKGIGFSPDYRGIYANLTVRDNLLLPLMALNISKEEQERRLAEVLEIFPELSPLLNRGGIQTSGGQQKIIAVARALILKPRLLLLDEPFEGLAPALRHKLLNKLTEIRTKMKCTLLIAEPVITPIKDRCDYIYKMERGTITLGG